MELIARRDFVKNSIITGTTSAQAGSVKNLMQNSHVPTASYNFDSWQEYSFSGATAVLFDFGKTTEAHLKSKNSATNLALVHRFLGVRIVHRDLSELFCGTTASEAQAEEIAKRWQSKARSVQNISHEVLCASASMFLILLEIIKQENAKAMAINCGSINQVRRAQQKLESFPVPPELSKAKLYLPCAAMVELYKYGIIPACEADINAMLSMMLLTHLAAKPSSMGNVLRGPSNTVYISHCVAPLQMLKGLCGYELTDYHGKDSDATFAIDLPKKSPATLARISRDLSQVHYAIGEVVGSSHDQFCRNTISVHLAEFGAFMQNKLDGHYALVCANIEDKLISWAKGRNITLVQEG